MLEMRFGVRAELILREIHKLSSVEVVERILRSAKTASRLEDLSAIWPGPHESNVADDQGNGET